VKKSLVRLIKVTILHSIKTKNDKTTTKLINCLQILIQTLN
jgi:hypothetical protein